MITYPTVIRNSILQFDARSLKRTQVPKPFSDRDTGYRMTTRSQIHDNSSTQTTSPLKVIDIDPNTEVNGYSWYLREWKKIKLADFNVSKFIHVFRNIMQPT